MLNLVQIQERLKDVPMQALMAYANGSNPQVPPFVALGELNRRKQMQESAAAEQAKEMEGAPTIKEQIEQQAGLISLQGDRQRQAGQLMQEQAINNPMLPAQGAAAVGEPVQMAGGGSVEGNPLLYRDYQQGGMARGINPEMLKRMAMMRAMQSGVRQAAPRRRLPEGGLGDLVPRRFRQGGPIAFQAGGQPKRPNVMRDWYTQSELGIGKLIEDLFGDKKRKEPVDPADVSELLKDTILEQPVTGEERTVSEAFMRDEPYPDELDRGSRRDLARPPSPPEEPPVDFPISERRTSGGAGIPSALRGYLGLDPEKAIPDVERQSAEQFKSQREGLNQLFGVSGDPYADLKRRYSDIEAEDARRRGEQPMDQLTAFLAGIAGSRRGARFGEAGAAGAMASSKLRAEQQALNRKQALDMATLRAAIAEKEDARARGDRDAFIAADAKAKEAQAKVNEDRLALRRNQAAAETSGRQAAAYEAQANRPTQYELDRAAYLRSAKQKGETPTEEGFQRFKLGDRASTVTTYEDARRLAVRELTAGAIEPPTEEQIEARTQSILRGAGVQPSAGAQPTALPMPPRKEDLVSGKVYNTARGLARWDAQRQQFIPVQ